MPASLENTKTPDKNFSPSAAPLPKEQRPRVRAEERKLGWTLGLGLQTLFHTVLVKRSEMDTRPPPGDSLFPCAAGSGGRLRGLGARRALCTSVGTQCRTVRGLWASAGCKAQPRTKGTEFAVQGPTWRRGLTRLV